MADGDKNKLLGIAQGWDEAADYCQKRAVEKFLASRYDEARALYEMAKSQREWSEKIFVNAEDFTEDD